MQAVLQKLDEILKYVRTTDVERYMDISELTEICSVSKSTIRREVKKGSLRCSKTLGKMLFKVSEVDSWLNNNKGDR